MNQTNVYLAYRAMRLDVELSKFEIICQLVKRNPAVIAEFIDGGKEGWQENDEEHQRWLNTATAREIANWVKAGL